MLVKDLIKALEKCDPEAEVYTEGCNTNEVFVVAQYTSKAKPTYNAVYIADELYYVDDGDMLGRYNKQVIYDESEDN